MILKKIKKPQDLQKLGKEELALLCQEIREKI